MRIIRLAAAFGACLLAACASSPPAHLPTRPAGEAFRGVQAPPPGHARIYVFRPAFNRAAVYDRPMLQIDGKEVVNLSVESYTDVLVKPGTYLVSLTPSLFESSAWSGTWRMTTSQDGIYFLAVWNQAEVVNMVVPLPIPGGLFVFTPMLVSQNAGLRIEHVSQSDALPIISNLTFLPPFVTEFEPVP